MKKITLFFVLVTLLASCNSDTGAICNSDTEAICNSDAEYLIELLVSVTNNVCPSSFGDGLILTKVENEANYVIYYYEGDPDFYGYGNDLATEEDLMDKIFGEYIPEDIAPSSHQFLDAMIQLHKGVIYRYYTLSGSVIDVVIESDQLSSVKIADGTLEFLVPKDECSNETYYGNELVGTQWMHINKYGQLSCIISFVSENTMHIKNFIRYSNSNNAPIHVQEVDDTYTYDQSNKKGKYYSTNGDVANFVYLNNSIVVTGYYNDGSPARMEFHPYSEK